jgi:hypothetical protein
MENYNFIKSRPLLCSCMDAKAGSQNNKTKAEKRQLKQNFCRKGRAEIGLINLKIKISEGIYKYSP